MILVDRLNRHRKRKCRIGELQKSTLAAFKMKYDPDPELNERIYFEVTRDDEHELDWLLQEPFLRTAEKWGLDIPAEYWTHDTAVRGATLTVEGKNWIKREAGKRRREWAKDWISILSPILASVIAILGLLVALMKH